MNEPTQETLEAMDASFTCQLAFEGVTPAYYQPKSEAFSDHKACYAVVMASPEVGALKQRIADLEAALEAANTDKTRYSGCIRELERALAGRQEVIGTKDLRIAQLVQKCILLGASLSAADDEAAMLDCMRHGIGITKGGKHVPYAEHSPTDDKSGDVQRKYDELLFAVGMKHHGESRHETALRYIRRAEQSGSSDNKAYTDATKGADKP